MALMPFHRATWEVYERCPKGFLRLRCFKKKKNMALHNSSVSNEPHDSNPYAILFIFTACAIGGKKKAVFV